MSNSRIMVAFLLLANLGCASERLYVKVVDDEGNDPNLEFDLDGNLSDHGEKCHRP